MPDFSEPRGSAVPYDFGEAKAAIERASRAQRKAEQEIRDAFKRYGNAERTYRRALARKLLELRAGGQPVTIVQDLAKGDGDIADLRLRRDLAEGVKEAAVSAVWRHTADRRELEQLIQWSLRVAFEGQVPEPAQFHDVTPRRVA